MGDFHPICPKCSKPMDRGHIPDAAHSVVLQQRWSRGDPEPRRFVGGIKWEADEQLPLLAYRCSGCGFVELYAPPAE
jgi:hypothetical protein